MVVIDSCAPHGQGRSCTTNRSVPCAISQARGYDADREPGATSSAAAPTGPARPVSATQAESRRDTAPEWAGLGRATERGAMTARLCSSRRSCANRLIGVSAVTKPSHVEPAFAGVLLDWRGTLVVAPTGRWLVRSALESLGRDCSNEHVDEVLVRLRNANVAEVESSAIDADTTLHRRAYFAWFTGAGLDERPAERLYSLESTPDLNPFAADAGPLLQTLHAANVRVGIVSDIHVDLRPAFALHKNADGSTWADLVDTWTLSYELGAAKPDPAIFTAALDGLELSAQQVLMVGDRDTHDGAAVELGITTLLLPPLQRSEACRLQRVVDLVLPGISLKLASRGEPSPNAYGL